MEIREAIEGIKNNNKLCCDNCEGECGSYKDGKCYCADALVISVLEEYIAIGTVEECWEARERQRAKKPLKGEPYTWTSSVRVRGRYRDVRKTSYHHVCPNCGENVAMDMSCCKHCGQVIDWGDTD